MCSEEKQKLQLYSTDVFFAMKYDLSLDFCFQLILPRSSRNLKTKRTLSKHGFSVLK